MAKIEVELHVLAYNDPTTSALHPSFHLTGRGECAIITLANASHVVSGAAQTDGQILVRLLRDQDTFPRRSRTQL